MEPDNLDAALEQQRKDEAEWLSQHPGVPVVEVPDVPEDVPAVENDQPIT